MRRENSLHELLKGAMHWLGKYCSFNPQVQSVEDGTWMQFTVWVQKKDKGTYLFAAPSLEVTNRPIPGNEPVVILNEWRDRDAFV